MTEIKWPPIEVAYTDEFGPVDPEVYQAAGSLWGKAEEFARLTLHDEAAGLSLMFKAIAIVSQKRAQHPDRINTLSTYLFQTYKNLIFAELEKENRHRHIEAGVQAGATPSPASVAEALDRKILLQEILQRMDAWTRQVFDWVALDYTFEEIGQRLRENPKTVKSKFHKRLRKLTEQMQAESRAADMSPDRKP